MVDGVRANLGRTLTAQGHAEEAMAHFLAIKQPDYFTQCGLALASLKGLCSHYFIAFINFFLALQTFLFHSRRIWETNCSCLYVSAGKFEEAYNGYTAALHWLAPDDSQKSHILVALASLQYKFQDSEEAKKLLFQG